MIDVVKLCAELCRREGVSLVTAARALRAAEASWPNADAAWLVDRAAYLIRRKGNK